MIERLIQNKKAMAVTSILAGVFLMIARKRTTTFLIRVLGYALLALAVVYFVLYFIGQRKDRIKLGYACGAAVAGILIRVLAPAVLNFFPMLLGAIIAIIGIGNLTAAKKQTYPKTSMIGPVLTIVLGAVILFRPGFVLSTVIFLGGAALVLNGLTELDLIRRS